ncbi:MAG: tetratricopeptide (TPR) repeat protein [Candidatus Paceibacteria bacterium]|jgi:tetratricopeptide (TPR) repeat protein
MNPMRRPGFALGAILLLAFLLRVAYILGSAASPYADDPIMDPLYHLQWAQAFANGESFQPGPFFRAPLYPWFLGAALRLSGENLLLVRLVQALLGTLTTGLGFALARQFFDRRVGLVAAFLIATNWVLIYFDGELLIPALSIPLNLLALWMTTRLAVEVTRKNAFLAGVCWGLAAIARPNVLLFLPACVLWLLWRTRPKPAQALLPSLFLVAGSLLPILPLTAYNATAGEDTVLISSQAGVNLWIGNNPASDGSSAIVPGTRPGWWEGFYDSIRLAEQAEGRTLKPSEVSAHYSARALGFFRYEPGAALRHLLWKLRLFWTDWELGNNADVRFFATQYTPWMAFLPSRLAWLGPLALIGLWLSWRRGSDHFPLWGFTGVYMASVVLFFVCSRFRAPLLPLFAIQAGAALVHGYDQWRAKRFGKVGLGLAVCLLFAAGMQVMPPGLDRSRATGLWALGIHELGQGQPRAAQPYFLAALEENPRSLYALRDLGLAHQQAGELREATERYEQALALKPDDFQTRSSLVDLLLARQQTTQADAIARKGLELSPSFATSYDAMARVLIQLQQYEQAAGVLQQGLEKAPDDLVCNMRLGGLLLQYLSQPCEAADALQRATRGSGMTEALAQGIAGALTQARQACAQSRGAPGAKD